MNERENRGLTTPMWSESEEIIEISYNRLTLVNRYADKTMEKVKSGCEWYLFELTREEMHEFDTSVTTIGRIHEYILLTKIRVNN